MTRHVPTIDFAKLTSKGDNIPQGKNKLVSPKQRMKFFKPVLNSSLKSNLLGRKTMTNKK